MPAKKPTAKKTPAWVAKALELTIHDLAETREKLAEADEQIKSGEVALLEMAKIVGVLNRGLAVETAKLAEEQERLVAEKHELRKQLAAEKTSVEFWTYEATRWRSEAEDLRRGEAMSRVERGVS